jgi:hypothetical protein
MIQYRIEKAVHYTLCTMLYNYWKYYWHVIAVHYTLCTMLYNY